jgi:dipeptidyl aminopeptidase/acylaminoacyl peptidase
MRKSLMTLTVAVVLAVLTVGSAVAQSSAAFVPAPVRDQAFELSIRNIMRAEENVGVAPGQVRWTDDSAWVYFSWRSGGVAWDTERSLYRVRADGTGLEALDHLQEEEVAPLIAGGDLSVDREWRVSSIDGDLYLVERSSMSVRRLTHTEDSEGQPLFASDGKSVLFRRGDNLFRLHLGNGTLTQVTHIASGPAPADDREAEGHKAFLEEQQRELFEHIRRGEASDERREAEEEELEAGDPETVYLARGERLQGLQSTRAGDFVLLRAGKRAGDAKQTIVPDWVTEDGYTRDLTVRSKVGDEQGSSRVGLLRTETGEITWIDVAPEEPAADEDMAEDMAEDEAEGGETEDAEVAEVADADANADADTAKARPAPRGSDPAPRVFNSGWNDAGTHAFLFAVSYDNKDRWLWSVEAETGERTLLDFLHDEAWVAGPCFAFCVGFLPDSNSVYFVSEESGYAHLYTVNADGSDKQALTSGEWEVLRVEIPESRDFFRLSTNEGSPFNQHAWRMAFDGGDRTALTEGEGRHAATFSPDGSRVAILHDRANRPPELFLADGATPMAMTVVTTSPTAEWLSFPWIKPEIVRFEAEDGTSVPARIYRPADMGADANGAGVIFVHGAGYLHNVHDYWSSYYREYQFNQFLAAAGYTVLDIDYRGSAGYGRDWRTAIYRWMGGKDLSDQVDGARFLVAQEGVDAQRIGLYGGSYGGFITLMGLFTAPDTFKSGAALRSVTDWAHYNHGYTSRILNLPHDDDEAYKKSSPIYFAENFRPDQYLVMLHGMVDTNVHFSDVVRLAQRLIELGKSNWEMALYPVESHGFVEPSSWTDEYRRIFELFERTLREPGCTKDGGLCSIRTSDE